MKDGEKLGVATDHEINKVKKAGPSPLVENLVKHLSIYPKSGSDRGILGTQEMEAYKTRMDKVISQQKIQEITIRCPWAIFYIPMV